MDQASAQLCISTDLLERQSSAIAALLDLCDVSIVVLNAQGQIVHFNQRCQQATGISAVQAIGKDFGHLLAEASRQRFYARINGAIRSGAWRDESVWAAPCGGKSMDWSYRALLNAEGQVAYWIGTGQECPLRGSQRVSSPVSLGVEAIAPGFQSLEVEEILSPAVAEIRAILQAERVTIYRLGEATAQFLVESVEPGWPSVLGQSLRIGEPQSDRPIPELTTVLAFSDIHQSGFLPDIVEAWARLQIRAWLSVPVVFNQQIWGLLCVHQCSASRLWQRAEIDLLQQLATQMAIALQQSALYRQVQQLNIDLELQVQERTRELQQAIAFSSILKCVTDKMRDSLDEHQILQTAVHEIGLALNVIACNAGIYDKDYTCSTIHHEYTTLSVSSRGQTCWMKESEAIYQGLLTGQHVQFCDGRSPDAATQFGLRSAHYAAILACPILDEQNALGDLWLFRAPGQTFSEAEIRLVQQVATQCAIAIRQARLYQKAQSQVHELERINSLKDDFLSAVSHELRTPVTSMRMALQLLGVSLNQELSIFSEFSKPKADQSRIARYFQILNEECEREIELINNLLDLQQLDTAPSDLLPEPIVLSSWLPPLLQQFQTRLQNRQQTLVIDFPDGLPVLVSVSICLKKILVELFNNAHKYTPHGEEIRFSVSYDIQHIYLQIINSGIEIPSHELPRIFDKFYRVPCSDPWKQSGTGLGLALVKKLVEQLKGQITVSSQNNETCFTVGFPLAPLTSTGNS